MLTPQSGCVFQSPSQWVGSMSLGAAKEWDTSDGCHMQGCPEFPLNPSASWALVPQSRLFIEDTSAAVSQWNSVNQSPGPPSPHLWSDFMWGGNKFMELFEQVCYSRYSVSSLAFDLFLQGQFRFIFPLGVMESKTPGATDFTQLVKLCELENLSSDPQHYGKTRHNRMCIWPQCWRWAGLRSSLTGQVQ